MITQIFSLLASLYSAIGPGFLLALAWPVFLFGLIVVIRAQLGPTPAE